LAVIDEKLKEKLETVEISLKNFDEQSGS